ncbi:MAG: hypothetical protein Q7U01_10465, partial [Pseudomonas sp.]|nr:hypothetical protein [Pseudomonas sp.]
MPNPEKRPHWAFSTTRHTAVLCGTHLSPPHALKIQAKKSSPQAAFSEQLGLSQFFLDTCCLARQVAKVV